MILSMSLINEAITIVAKKGVLAQAQKVAFSTEKLRRLPPQADKKALQLPKGGLWHSMLERKITAKKYLLYFIYLFQKFTSRFFI
jgi:hypothetical protein